MSKLSPFSGCIGVHFVGAIWSLLCVGLFAKKDVLRTGLGITHNHFGLVYVSSGSPLLLTLSNEPLMDGDRDKQLVTSKGEKIDHELAHEVIHRKQENQGKLVSSKSPSFSVDPGPV